MSAYEIDLDPAYSVIRDRDSGDCDSGVGRGNLHAVDAAFV